MRLARLPTLLPRAAALCVLVAVVLLQACRPDSSSVVRSRSPRSILRFQRTNTPAKPQTVPRLQEKPQGKTSARSSVVEEPHEVPLWGQGDEDKGKRYVHPASGVLKTTVPSDYKGQEQMRKFTDFEATHAARLSHHTYDRRHLNEKEDNKDALETAQYLLDHGFSQQAVSIPREDKVPLWTLHVKDDTLYLTFRGSIELADWIIDVAPLHRYSKELKCNVQGAMSLALENGNDQKDVLNDIEEEITRACDANPKIDRLVVSGHSLGGAYALIASMSFIGTSRFSALRQQFPKGIHTRTFGAPMVICPPDEPIPDKPGHWWNEFHKNTVSYINRDDPVPRMGAAEWLLQVLPETVDSQGDEVLGRWRGPVRTVANRMGLNMTKLFQYAARSILTHKQVYLEYEPIGNVIFIQNIQDVSEKDGQPVAEKESDLQLFYALGNAADERVVSEEMWDGKHVAGWFPSSTLNVMDNHDIKKYINGTVLLEKWFRDDRTFVNDSPAPAKPPKVKVYYGKKRPYFKMDGSWTLRRSLEVDPRSSRIIYIFAYFNGVLDIDISTEDAKGGRHLIDWIRSIGNNNVKGSVMLFPRRYSEPGADLEASLQPSRTVKLQASNRKNKLSFQVREGEVLRFQFQHDYGCDVDIVAQKREP